MIGEFQLENKTVRQNGAWVRIGKSDLKALGEKSKITAKRAQKHGEMNITISKQKQGPH